MRIPEINSNKPSRRQAVSKALSQALVQRLYSQAEMNSDIESFRERLVHILYRYERNRPRRPRSTRKTHRTDLERLEKALVRLMDMIDIAHQDTLTGIGGQLADQDLEKQSHLPLEEMRFQEFGPWAETTESFENRYTAIAQLLRAIKHELSAQKTFTGSRRSSSNPALDQLIIDLAATYEIGTGKTPASHCYYIPSIDTYGGGFFEFTITLLESHASDSFFSRLALGKRIQRVLDGTCFKDNYGEKRTPTVL